MLSSTLTGVTVAVAELVECNGLWLRQDESPHCEFKSHQSPWASRNGKQALPQPESPYVGIVLSANMPVFQTGEVGAAPTIHFSRHKAGKVLIVNLTQ